MAGRQGREELIKQGLLEMMEQGKRVPGRVADLSEAHGDCDMRPMVDPIKFDGFQNSRNSLEEGRDVLW